MNPLAWYLIGILTLPIGTAIVMGGDWIAHRFRRWYTRPLQLEGKTLAARRALITGLTLELLDARHVRAIRLPFNRAFIIRSNPKREYDFVGEEWVMIGDDYKNTSEIVGKVLDELGYAETES
ncbi:Uncharacterised protein [Mycobacteroides abscessus subsp. bolletii]|uniref:hypothetical protein n=1 Tax=Mycobacteroides abscessus TaxID=36809 RepID=UPI0009A66954|nr:hypothetical protein [Mycobacteroides abscessus]SKX80493.1 Uncharacterised protein [Mycobacteroides abscessus subsp. bolletii]